MKNTTIGIDISKDTLDYCYIDIDTHEKTLFGVIKNTKTAINKWLKSLDINTIEFSMEHTGHYGALLVSILNESNACYYLVNPFDLKKSMGIQRGKTDAIDAYRIASYTITNKHRLVPYKLPSNELCKLKALITARQLTVKMSVQIKNSIKANEILNKTINVKDIIAQEKKQLQTLAKSIDFFEAQMLEVISSTEELKSTFTNINTVIGVGLITSVKIITETENFTKFTNPRKFCCHCGLAPFKYQSGTSVNGRTKTHFLRDKSLKSIMFQAAGSAIQHDPQLKAYYKRKVSDGKHKLTALNAVANKLVLRVFAVAKREGQYVKLFN